MVLQVFPRPLAQELLAYHDTLPDFIQTVPANNCPLLEQLKSQLDPGEVEAIVLAKEHRAFPPVAKLESSHKPNPNGAGCSVYVRAPRK